MGRGDLKFQPLFFLSLLTLPLGTLPLVRDYSPLYGQSGLPPTIKIGGLFDSDDSIEEAAFKHAVERVNADYSVLPHSRLTTLLERIPPLGDSFFASGKVCQMMREGIAGIFGPASPSSASHVQSICDAFEIPHIETRWDYKLRGDNYLINLYPHPGTLARAFNDLVEAFGWEKYVILYEDQEGLFRLQDLLRASEPPMRRAILKQLPEGDDFRSVLKEVVKDPELKKVVIDCHNSKVPSVLKQAQQVGMMTFEYSYIITSLDLHWMNLEDFRYADLNITAFRMVDPTKPDVAQAIQEWNAQHYSTSLPTHPEEYSKDHPEGEFEPIPITTEMALVYDAVLLFGKALHVLDSSQRIEIQPLNCESERWQHGYSIINYMKMVQLQGMTGLVQFNTTGFRTEINMDVIQLSQKGLIKIGSWDSKYHSKFNWTKLEDKVEDHEDMSDEANSLRNKTLIATTIMNAPFCMLTRSQTPLKGNERYEGFNIDLLNELSQKLGFNYILKIVDDGAYGSFNNKTKTWNGMIREVIDEVADLAIGDITINKDRQAAVAFSHPFMNLGISILFTTPKVKPPSLFSFMSPFGLDVWVYMGFAFFGVSFILFILARISPYEWDCPYPCIEEPEWLENQFSIVNSFWFTIGSIMQQGSDVAPKISAVEWTVANPCSKDPLTFTNELTLKNVLWITMAGGFRQKPDIWPKAVSTRLLAGIWWFFTLIMVSSYTANLATFLIVQDLDDTIKNLDDLARQTKVQYGCVSTGSTASFFRDSPFESKRKIWDNMLKMKPSPFLKSNKEGLNKVKEAKGKYAFFMESTVIEYNIERECGLAQLGGFLDSKGYGIALKKESKFRQAFNSGILSLQETGVLETLKRKWWKEERKEGDACEAESDAEVKPLALANVGGVFVVLVMGCAVSVLLAFGEFFLGARKIQLEEGESRVQAMKKDLIFALKCSGDTKPARKRSSIATSGNTGTLNGIGKDKSSSNNGSIESGRFLEDSYGFPLKKTSRDDFN